MGEGLDFARVYFALEMPVAIDIAPLQWLEFHFLGILFGFVVGFQVFEAVEKQQDDNEADLRHLDRNREHTEHILIPSEIGRIELVGLVPDDQALGEAKDGGKALDVYQPLHHCYRRSRGQLGPENRDQGNVGDHQGRQGPDPVGQSYFLEKYADVDHSHQPKRDANRADRDPRELVEWNFEVRILELIDLGIVFVPMVGFIRFFFFPLCSFIDRFVVIQSLQHLLRQVIVAKGAFFGVGDFHVPHFRLQAFSFFLRHHFPGYGFSCQVHEVELRFDFPEMFSILSEVLHLLLLLLQLLLHFH